MDDYFGGTLLLFTALFVFIGATFAWWVPIAIIGVIVVSVIIYLLYLRYQSYCEKLVVSRNALIKRADEEHWWLMNGAIEDDVEAMYLGFYGQYPPERIAA